MAASTLITVVHASTGSGQRMAAEALIREVSALGGDAVAVETLDLADHVPRWCIEFADGVLGRSPAGRIALNAASPVLASASKRLAQKITELSPAVVVCTHPLAALVAGRRAHVTRYRVASVETDFGVPGLSPRTGLAMRCVADEHADAALVKRGVHVSAIRVTGIPVRAQFSVEYDVAASRAHFGLPVDKRLILAIVGAGDSEGRTEFTQALETALPALAALPDTTLVVVTGGDADLANRLRSRSHGFTMKNVHVFEHVEYMGPLMAASDLAIARPVGLICAECLCAGVPMLVVGPAHGRERDDVRALADAGAAAYASDPRVLVERTRRVLADPAAHERMREAARTMARPHATTDAARGILALAGVATDAGEAAR